MTIPKGDPTVGKKTVDELIADTQAKVESINTDLQKKREEADGLLERRRKLDNECQQMEADLTGLTHTLKVLKEA